MGRPGAPGERGEAGPEPEAEAGGRLHVGQSREPGKSQCGSFADGAGGPRSRLTTGKRRLKSPFPAQRQTAEVC